MKYRGLPILVAALALAISNVASAKMDDAQAKAEVAIILYEGGSTGDVIDALVADGRELEDACVLAVLASEEERRLGFIEACVGATTTLEQAQSVATALTEAAGSESPIAQQVAQVMSNFNTQTLPPPSTYQGDGIATGGGSVSPSS